MNLVVNGEAMVCQEKRLLSEALSAWGYSLDMPMAIAINNAVIHKSAYSQQMLQADDVIEILMPMQGG